MIFTLHLMAAVLWPYPALYLFNRYFSPPLHALQWGERRAVAGLVSLVSGLGMLVFFPLVRLFLKGGL